MLGFKFGEKAIPMSILSIFCNEKSLYFGYWHNIGNFVRKKKKYKFNF